MNGLQELHWGNKGLKREGKKDKYVERKEKMLNSWIFSFLEHQEKVKKKKVKIGFD